MNNRTLLYILIFVVLFFLAIDLIALFTRTPNFQVVFYDTNILADYSSIVTITTTSGLRFKNEKKKEEYLRVYKDTSRQTFERYFSEVSKEIGKNISVVDVKSSWKERDGILEITESVTLNGLVEIELFDDNGLSYYKLDMGKVKINPIENSNMKVVLPIDAVVEHIEPTPTLYVKNSIIWKSASLTYFPKIIYKRGENK